MEEPHRSPLFCRFCWVPVVPIKAEGSEVQVGFEAACTQ